MSHGTAVFPQNGQARPRDGRAERAGELTKAAASCHHSAGDERRAQGPAAASPAWHRYWQPLAPQVLPAGQGLAVVRSPTRQVSVLPTHETNTAGAQMPPVPIPGLATPGVNPGRATHPCEVALQTWPAPQLTTSLNALPAALQRVKEVLFVPQALNEPGVQTLMQRLKALQVRPAPQSALLRHSTHWPPLQMLVGAGQGALVVKAVPCALHTRRLLPAHVCWSGVQI